MGLYPVEQSVIKEWKSLKTLHAFLVNEFERINNNFFAGALPLVQIRIKRTWFKRGLLGREQPIANYDQSTEEDPAKISLFPGALLSERDARTALVHEMIHHWEATTDEVIESPSCPTEINRVISKRHANKKREQKWRATHSPQFIQKACAVAAKLGVASEELLFKE